MRRVGWCALAIGLVGVAVLPAVSGDAWAADLVVRIDNQSQFGIVELHVAPAGKPPAEEDILGVPLVLPGAHVDVTIRDATDDVCDYALKFVLDDGDEISETATDLCKSRAFTVTD